MEGRRIEPGHLDMLEGLDRRSRPDVTDKALVTEQQVVTDDAAEAEEFQALLQGLFSPGKTAPAAASLRGLRAEFVTPSLTDPAVLSGDRASALLERLLTTILPQLPESAEFRALATAVIGDEIEHRRRLRVRRLRDAAT